MTSAPNFQSNPAAGIPVWIVSSPTPVTPPTPFPATIAASGTYDSGLIASTGPSILFGAKLVTEAMTMTLIRYVDAGGLLVLDTTGGRVDSGQLIINSLQELNVPLVCVIDGDGISMGYLMLQDVCQVRLMTDHSDLMIHEIRMGGAVEIPGTRGEAKSFEEMMRVMNEGWMTMAAKRMGLTLDQLMAHIRNSAWWMSPEEALANHAVDAVVHNIHSQVIKPLEDGLQLPADLPQVRPAVQLPAPKPLSHAHKKPAGQPSRSSHR